MNACTDNLLSHVIFSDYSMAKSTAAIWVSIFVAGLIAGVITSIGMKYGIEPDETSVRIYALEKICEATQGMNDKIAYNCAIFVPLAIVLSIILAIASAFGEASRAGNWKVGIAIYGSGWIVGLVWMLSYLK